MPSSVIRAMRFDPVRSVLEIAFRGARGVYRYFGVPADEWQRFRSAPSKGEYLNGFFKGKRFRYEKALVPVLSFDGDDTLRWDDSSAADQTRASLRRSVSRYV